LEKKARAQNLYRTAKGTFYIIKGRFFDKKGEKSIAKIHKSPHAWKTLSGFAQKKF
jgi:hypothetical protein